MNNTQTKIPSKGWKQINSSLKRKLWTYTFYHNHRDDIIQEILSQWLELSQKDWFSFDPDYIPYWNKRFISQYLYKFNKKQNTKSKRKTGNTSADCFSDAIDPTESPEQYLITTEFEYWCDDNLNEKQQRLIELKSQDLSNKQCSEILGCSQPNITQQLKKIQKKYHEFSS